MGTIVALTGQGSLIFLLGCWWIVGIIYPPLRWRFRAPPIIVTMRTPYAAVPRITLR
jgi:hypothetical protein